MKKSSVILAILLLALFAFTVTSVIAWYKKDVKENVLLNENIESLDANYIYKNIESKNKSIIIISATGHGMFKEPYKNRVYEEVYKFVKRA